MGVLKEWLCPGHGAFESDEPRCPQGCNVAEREFRTAPAIGTGRVGRTDRLLDGIAKDHGVSNFRTAHEGESSRVSNPQANRMAEFQKSVHKKYPSLWGAVPKDGGAAAALAAHNAPATNAVAEAKSLLVPKPVQYIQDKQNLKLDLTKAA